MNRNVDRTARRVALWTLYAIDVSGTAPGDELAAAYATLSDQEPELDAAWEEVRRRVLGTMGELDALDPKIQAVSPRWKIERMARIDRNLLRLGAWEILHGGISPLLVINSCVDLAKEFGEKSTPAFVNGLLDQLCTEHDIPIQ